MFFKTRDDLFLFLEHGKYEKYLSEFMEQQKQIKAPSKRRGLCVWSVADLRCLPAGQRLGNDLREVVYGQCPAAGNGFFTKRAGRYDRTGSGGGEHVGNALADPALAVVADRDVAETRATAEGMLAVFGYLAQFSDHSDHFPRRFVNAAAAAQFAGVVVGEHLRARVQL